jgi:hypothetical protein
LFAPVARVPAIGALREDHHATSRNPGTSKATPSAI